MKVRDIYDKILFKPWDRLHLQSVNQRTYFKDMPVIYYLGLYMDMPEKYMGLDVNAIKAEQGTESMIYTILIDD